MLSLIIFFCRFLSSNLLFFLVCDGEQIFWIVVFFVVFSLLVFSLFLSLGLSISCSVNMLSSGGNFLVGWVGKVFFMVGIWAAEGVVLTGILSVLGISAGY